MKKKIILPVFALISGIFFSGNVFAENEGSVSSVVEVSFDYKKAFSLATNQTAVWVEDEGGKVVKTVYVSDFTAKKRGYRKRENALVHWVAAVNPDSLSDKEIDAVSAATLKNGTQKFIWDLTDSSGSKVADGKYFIKVEGTLYWKSNVLYSAQVDLSGGALKVGEIQQNRSEPANTKNENMILNVRIFAD